MSIATTKKHFIRIILLFVVALCVNNSALFGQDTGDPVISTVNVNSCLGIITLSVDGDKPFTYEWKDSGGTVVGNTRSIAGLTPGDYTVTITDNNGDTTTATYTITSPPNLTGDVTVNEVTCRGDADAQVIVDMTNGNSPYSWELFNSGGVSIQTGSTPAGFTIITLNGLGAGDYTLSVTDINTCTGDIPFTITEPAEDLSHTPATATDATCFNSTDGSVSATGLGGWGDYVYSWRRVSDGVIVGNTATVTGLAPGQYRLVLVDRNGTGCEVTSPVVTVGSPPEINQSASITNALCNGDSNGSINLSVSGGVGPYTYSWSNGATTQDISGLAAGTYTVTITDAAGCTDTETYTVGEPAVLTASPSVTNVLCFGESTGSIDSNVSGGTAPYTYSWSYGGIITEDIDNLPAGTYSLTVTDDKGCSVTVNGITITQPTAALSKQSELLNNPTCFGGADGSITITMQGGTGAYDIDWSNGDSGPTATGLTAGIHSVAVTDNNGCTYTESFTLNNPAKIAVTPTITPTTCNGGADGAISVSATNGSGSYTYSWAHGPSGTSVSGLVAGSYTVTVTDQVTGCVVTETISVTQPDVIAGNATVNVISCSGAGDGSIFLAATGGSGGYSYEWEDGSTNNNRLNLGPGNYWVDITDSNGCKTRENFNIVDPATMNISETHVDLVCKGGSSGAVDITVTGGTAPYSYAWDNGSGTFTTTEDLTNVPAGTYTVTVTDAGGCSIATSVTLTEPATELVLSGTETDVSCFGGSNGAIDLTVTGGGGGYTYAWVTPSGTANTEDLNSISAGNYTVTVTDANGCVKSLGFTISQPAPLNAIQHKTDVTCNGANDGTIDFTVTGGTGPYTYSWADDAGITTKNRTGLTPGNYTLTIRDDNGCQIVETFTIAERAVLTAAGTAFEVSCFGESTGSINLTVSGGTTPYTYAWDDGPANTKDRTNLAADTYEVTVTDARGCEVKETFIITQPTAPLAITGSATDITCNGAADGIININVTGGTAPYSYNWSDGSSNEDRNGLPAGNYNVTVTDAKGCEVTASYVITDPPLLVASGVETNVSCNGAADGEIDLTVSGGGGTYTYVWTTPSGTETTEDITGLGPGNYSVTIQDDRGCSVIRNFVITEPTAMAFGYTSSDVLCFGESNGSIDITVTGGSGAYTYQWADGPITEDRTNLAAADYEVTVTDANGCQLIRTITIAEPAATLSTTANVVDISCFGGSDGYIELTPAGGTAPYTYEWSNLQSTKDVFGLAQGSYTVKITDDNGCFIEETYTINMPPALQVSGTQTNLDCNGDADGVIDLTVTGGTGPYTFTWSDIGVGPEDRTGLDGGNYTVTITDASGCSLNRSFTIVEPLGLTVNPIVSNVSCFGVGDGSIDLSVSGGVAPYSYSWSNGETTQDLFNISGGTYTVDITDGNGCVSSYNYAVTEPTAALSVTETITDETCFGDNQGAIDVTVTGGTAPYTYVWNNGSTNQDVSGLGQATYQLTVTDANGCFVVNNYTISGPTEIVVTGTTDNISCNGANDGSIDITPAGGIGPYTYSWSNGATTEDLTGLGPNTYTVTITDDNNCTEVKSFTITEPLALAMSASVDNVSCEGANDGDINVSVSGGVTPYTYNWTDGPTTQDRAGLDGGVYELEVTDANGCTITQSFTVTEPTALGVTANVVDETCFGDNTGEIELTVSGGTTPYSYTWNNGVTSRDLGGLSQGNYQVTIEDANGCTIVANYTVGGPTQIITSATTTNVSCNGGVDGVIDLTVTGGDGPYVFAWSNGETTEDISGLTAQNYSVQITDDNGCVVNRSFTITEPLALNLTGVTSDVTCNGAADGSINTSVSGGVTPYTFEWDDTSNKKDRTNLSGGTYTLKVTDANGCEINQSFTINEPDPLVGTAVVTDETCFGDNLGAIDLSVTGGTGPYQYSWNNGATTQDISNLSQGTYQVNITDANNCVLVETFTVTGPTQLLVSGTNTNLTCNGAGNGEIDLAVSGGTGPYTYAWSTTATTEDVTGLNAGNHSVTVTDANGCSVTRSFTVVEPLALNLSGLTTDVTCNGAADGSINASISGGVTPYTYEWADGTTTQDRFGLSGGTYSLKVTDANGCEINQSFTIAEPNALAVTGTVTNENCYSDAQGAIQLTVSGGTAPYTYDWDNNAVTKDISGLTQGTYEVTITDANGCEIIADYTVGGPTELVLSGTVTNLTCNGAGDGEIDLTVAGGVGPYTFDWGGETTEDRTNLAAGTYSVVVTDANGCSKTRTFTVTQPTVLAASNNVIDVDCYGAGNGSITLTVGGGTLPYTYAWSTGATTQNVSGLDGGTYSVTITDANNCDITQTITVGEPSAPLTVLGNTTDELCFGDNSGTISLNVTGGTGPYTYNWSNGSTNRDLTGLSAGSYQVEVTDANGCSQIETYLISSPSALTISGAVSDISCFGAADGEIDLTVAGGTGPYTYVWSNGETTEDLVNLDESSYNVTVTDANGCSISASYSVSQPAALAIGYTVNDVDCFGANDGSILVNVTGGTAPYNYSWGDGQTTSSRSGLSGGNYNLQVTDANGCVMSQTITVNEPAAPLTATEVITDENCFGDNQGAIELLVNGGTAPYTYQWNNGSSTQNIYGLSRGDYQVRITDTNGCQIQHTYTVGGPDLFTIAGTEEDVTCNGADDGVIDLTLAGGTAPYTYAWSNGAATEDLQDLGPGNYSVVVTDANGCTVSGSYTIREPLVLTINQQVSDVTCFGANDGAIDVAVSGGNLPYTYTWSNGSGSEDLNNLAGGVYQLQVTDAKGCQVTSNIVVNAPSAALDVTGVVTDVTCFGQPNGGVTLNVTGGTGPYNYSWSNGSNQPNLINAHAGDYSITVTDAKGCEFVANYTISEPDALDVTFATTPVSCFGDADGSIVAAPQGGTGPYSFVWSNGSTSKDLIGISGGTYNLTVIDANNCTVTKSVVVGESSDLIVNINKRDVLCKGESSGLIDLEVTGGSGSYTYAWGHGASEGTLTDLAAGVYQVLVTDAGGCSTTASVVIAEPAQALSATVTGTTDLVCYGDTSGVLEVNAVGGVGPYTYTWSNGARTNLIANVGAGTYRVFVRDANECVVELTHTITQPTAPISIHAQGKLNLDCKDENDGRIVVDIEGGEAPYDILWSTGSRASSISNLSAGDYTVRVRDAKGCVQEKVFTINEPEELIIANAIVNESQCYNDRNGSIELDIEGGTAPYSYQWSNGATTKNLIGITSGNYVVTITDASGCQVQGSYSLDTPGLFEMNPDVKPISCIGANDASISLNIAGGIDPVAIQWNTGASSETVSNLSPGEYNVLITDKNGCNLQQTFNIFEPLELTLDAFVQDATECNNPQSGQVNVIVTGGTEPYNFRWSNGATTSSIENVLPGTYVVEVTDRYGCSVQGTYSVLQPEPLQIGLSTQPYIDCNRRVAGILVTADVKGGVGNYNYSWSRGDGETDEILLTTPGRLTLEITDDRGCFQMNSVDIDIPELGEADFEYNAISLDETGDLAMNDPVSFFDLSVGEILDWYWDFGDGFDSDEIDPIHTYDASGTYTVTLTTTDRTGCTSTKTAVLDIGEGYRVMLPNAFTPNGDGNNDFFRPRLLGLTEMRLIIYNTWGEIVFSTDNIETKGWDGTVDGKRAENGNYVYKIIGKSFNGLDVERDGVFALIH